MARCSFCGSYDADPDIGLCYQCFVGDNPAEREPDTAELCASDGHPRYENGNGTYGDRCYCGAVSYEDPVRGDAVPIDEQL